MVGRRPGALALAVIAVAILSSCGKDKPSSEPAAKIMRVTGIPDENPTELQRKYQPMVDSLKAQLGTDVQYVPVTDDGAAVQALSAGKIDFAWLGGFTHVQARVMDGAVPLCMRDIDRQFKSVFIAGADSGIATPADLKGKTFAFGAKRSTSGAVLALQGAKKFVPASPADFDATEKVARSTGLLAGK